MSLNGLLWFKGSFKHQVPCWLHVTIWSDPESQVSNCVGLWGDGQRFGFVCDPDHICPVAATPSTVISFVFVVFSWMSLQDSNSWTVFRACWIFVSFCCNSVMSFANSMWQNGVILGRPWLTFSVHPMSSRHLDSVLIKREKRRGERTLSWVTPVLIDRCVYWHSNILCPYKLVLGPQFRLS